MPSPSLYHHEQVECLPVQAVVSLEIPSGIFHEPFNFAGQQHFGEHRAVVVSRFVRGMVSYGEGNVCVMVLAQFHSQFDRLERGIFLLYPLYGDEGFVVVVMVHEKEAVCINPSFCVKERDLVYACGERSPIYVYGVLSRGVGREFPDGLAYAIALYLNPQFLLAFGGPLYNHPQYAVFPFHMQGISFLFHFR